MEVSICWTACILQTTGLLQERKVMTSHLNILPVMTIGIVTEQVSLGSTVYTILIARMFVVRTGLWEIEC